MADIKQKAFDHCRAFVVSRQEAIAQAIGKIKESLVSETKSTAGDKHETGRAMLQLEREKLGRQLAEIKKLDAIIQRIDPSKTNGRVALGSLVVTDKAQYFIALSAGVVPGSVPPLYCVSTQTPIGRSLLGKTVGERFVFNEIESVIKALE
ncbi:3-oxoacyl-ACP synthase [Flagellimonas sp. DF-77]|uniref:3-oxoacyl-ACP synthase n=1 Tax=Flagellimonas algarum TaxID=3230298 RepID=UPI003393F7CE